MKLNKIIMSQVIRFMDGGGDSDRGQEYNFVLLARRLEERYGFRQGPRTVAEYNPQSGITFLHGMFQNKFLIERFQIYDNGVICEMPSSTEVCEQFLDDCLAWSIEEFQLKIFEKKTPPRGYLSQIEVVLDKEAAFVVDKLVSFGESLSDVLAKNGHNLPPYQLWGFKLNLDPKLDVLKPAEFVFERRAGKAFNEQVFYSSAPVQTDEHLALLRQLELLWAG